MKKDIAEGRKGMFTKLIEVEKIYFNAGDYEIRFYQNTNFNGNTRFTSEVDIGLNDKIILDDQSMASLRYKVSLVLPVSLQIRREWQRLRK